jgi:hypothetical protein
MSSLKNRPGRRAKRPQPQPLEEIIDRLDSAVQQASEKETRESASSGNRPLPFPLSATRGESDRQAAIGTIRRFRQDESLAVRFLAVALNPYASDGRTMETYEDDQGYEYWIAPSDDRLIQAAPSAGQFAAPYQVGPADRLAVAELRGLALTLIGQNVPSFETTRPCLHPLEDNRDRQVYFFRFDDFRQPVPESELPPFVQVSLRADGRLVSYTNTLPADMDDRSSDSPKQAD